MVYHKYQVGLFYTNVKWGRTLIYMLQIRLVFFQRFVTRYEFYNKMGFLPVDLPLLRPVQNNIKVTNVNDEMMQNIKTRCMKTDDVKNINVQ